MSDRLVQLQEWVSQYPSWMVAGGVGFVVVIVGIMLWKALRLAMTALIVAVVLAGGWYVWETFSGKENTAGAPMAAPAAVSSP